MFGAACLDGWSGTPSRQPQPPRLRAEEGNNIIRPLNFGFSTSKLVLLWILLLLLQNRERGEGQEKLNTFTGLCLSRKSKKPEGGWVNPGAGLRIDAYSGKFKEHNGPDSDPASQDIDATISVSVGKRQEGWPVIHRPRRHSEEGHSETLPPPCYHVELRSCYRASPTAWAAHAPSTRGIFCFIDLPCDFLFVLQRW